MTPSSSLRLAWLPRCAALIWAALPARAADAASVELLEATAEAQSAIAAWDYRALRAGANRLAAAPARTPDGSFTRAYWLGTLRFHALLHLREREDAARFETAMDDWRDGALDALREAVALRPDHAESHAMMAVLQGLAITDRPVSALWRGRSFLRHRKAAEEEADTNPRVAYLLGVSLLRRADSEADTREALNRLLEAAALFEQAEAGPAPRPGDPRWGRDHALLFIGIAYERLGEWSRAAVWFQKAADANPNLQRAMEGVQRCTLKTEER